MNDNRAVVEEAEMQLNKFKVVLFQFEPEYSGHPAVNIQTNDSNLARQKMNKWMTERERMKEGKSKREWMNDVEGSLIPPRQIVL